MVASKHDEVFLGREISQKNDYSEQTAQVIDTEIRSILIKASDKAEALLKENIDILHNASKILLERETIDGQELDMIIRGEELPPLKIISKLAKLVKDLPKSDITKPIDNNESPAEPSIA